MAYKFNILIKKIKLMIKFKHTDLIDTLVNVNIQVPKSQFIIHIISIIFVWTLCFSEEHSSNNFQLSLSCRSSNGAHLNLTLEWTVFPIIIRILIILIHFYFLFCILMNQFKYIRTIKYLIVYFTDAFNYPIIISIKKCLLSSPSPPLPKHDTSWPFVIIDWNISSECKFFFVKACSNLIASPHLTYSTT